MDTLDGNWSAQKAIIELSREQGGLRKAIPKSKHDLFTIADFPYFFVDFSLQFGYVHVIDNERAFSQNFAYVLFLKLTVAGDPGLAALHR